ncbi:MAG: GNAT family N-acetyltransferase [Pseudomonadota bacterium]|nr:GNAT family N-acetyltransferase [Pseudomonadota bacterium]
MELKFLADQPDAVPIIAKWYYSEWGHCDPNNSIENTCTRINGKLNKDKVPLHIIATNRDNVMGVAQLKTHEMSIYPDREYWLGSVYVDTPYRGQKVAQNICVHSIKTARSFGIKTLYLQTEALENGGLYGKLGWQPLERVHYNGADVLVMEKHL